MAKGGENMSKENPGKIRQFARERLNKTKEKTKQGALKASHPLVVSTEWVAGVAGTMELGTQYEPQRFLGEGIRNVITHGMNFGELGQALGNLANTVREHPDHAGSVLALGGIVGVGEVLRRVIRNKIKR